MPPRTILLEPTMCDDKCKKVREMLEESVGKDGFVTISMDWAVGKGLIEALRIEDTKSSKVIIIQDGDELEVVEGGEDDADKRDEPKT